MDRMESSHDIHLISLPCEYSKVAKDDITFIYSSQNINHPEIAIKKYFQTMYKYVKSTPGSTIGIPLMDLGSIRTREILNTTLFAIRKAFYERIDENLEVTIYLEPEADYEFCRSVLFDSIDRAVTLPVLSKTRIERRSLQVGKNFLPQVHLIKK